VDDVALDPAGSAARSVNLGADTLDWLTDASHWSGDGSVPQRLAEHLLITVVVLVIALLVAAPLGVLIGHTGRGVASAVAVAGALRALPTLGVVTLVGLWVGIGLQAPIVALVILAIPPPLAGFYAGIRAVDRDVVDTARAVGMSEWGIIREVELPLAASSIVGGVRSAILQIVSTVTVAAYIADDGLGRYVLEGLRTRDYAMMLAGSVLVIALALLLDGLCAGLQRIVGRRNRYALATAD